MPSLKEVADKVNFLLTNGDDNAERKCHFGLVDVEAKERVANPKGRTRLIKEMESPDAYSEWNAEFDRYVAATGNPMIAHSIMLRLLKQLPDSSIRKLAEDEQEQPQTLGDA